MKVRLAAEVLDHTVVAGLYTLVSAGKKYFTTFSHYSEGNIRLRIFFQILTPRK
jgi:hypothetical protein